MSAKKCCYVACLSLAKKKKRRFYTPFKEGLAVIENVWICKSEYERDVLHICGMIDKLSGCWPFP